MPARARPRRRSGPSFRAPPDRFFPRLCRVLLFLFAGAAGPPVGAGELLDLLARAEQNNADYQAAVAAARALREQVGVSRAGLLPSVMLTAGAGGTSQDIDLAPGAVGLDGRQSFDARNYEFRAEQPLFRLDRWFALKQADKRVAQAEAEVAAARSTLVAELVARYFAVLEARSKVALAAEDIETLKTRLALVETQVKEGVAIEALLLQAQSELDIAEAEFVQAEADEYIARAALAETVGEEVDVYAGLREAVEISPLVPQDLIAWQNDAELQNPRLLAAVTAIEIAAFDERIATTGHLPTVDIVGTYGYNQQGGRFGNTDIDESSIAVEVEVPLFQGGAVLARRRAARARRDEVKARADAERHAVIRDAVEAYQRVVASARTVQASARAVDSAEASLAAIDTQFDAGTRTLSELRDAEQDVLDSRRRRLEATLNHLVQRTRLLAVSGNLSLDAVAELEVRALDVPRGTGAPRSAAPVAQAVTAPAPARPGALPPGTEAAPAAVTVGIAEPLPAAPELTEIGPESPPLASSDPDLSFTPALLLESPRPMRPGTEDPPAGR